MHFLYCVQIHKIRIYMLFRLFLFWSNKYFIPSRTTKGFQQNPHLYSQSTEVLRFPLAPNSQCKPSLQAQPWTRPACSTVQFSHQGSKHLIPLPSMTGLKRTCAESKSAKLTSIPHTVCPAVFHLLQSSQHKDGYIYTQQEDRTGYWFSCLNNPQPDFFHFPTIL